MKYLIIILAMEEGIKIAVLLTLVLHSQILFHCCLSVVKLLLYYWMNCNQPCHASLCDFCECH